MWVCASLVLVFYLAAVPITAAWLQRRLDTTPPIDPGRLDADVIVVLGGGRRRGAPEYGGDTLSANSLERIRYAALLHKRTGLPLLVSGGTGRDEGLTEAELMADALAHEFGVPVRWREARSRDTFENARYCALLLEPLALRKIALVSHTWHMPRAAAAFRRSGFEVVPAPTGGAPGVPVVSGLAAWRPRAASLCQSATACHEIAGSWWYRWRRT